jgi:regulator of protease activity HflC (stomatin/prohibitin superfamily)
MSRRIALASLVAADLFLLWRLFQGDPGAPGLASRETVVLAMASCTFLAIAVGLALLLPSRPRRAALLVVRDGVVRRGDGELASIIRGRSVPVVVQEGHVAVLEKLGRYSRTLGPGQGKLDPGETIHKVLFTSPRPLVGTSECSTRDSVPITADFELDARILPARGEAGSRRASLPAASQTSGGNAPTRGFAWSQEAVLRAAYSAPSWEVATLNAARNSLRVRLASALLEEIFDSEERHREALPFSALADQIRLELNDQCRAWGAEVLRFQLNRVQIPAPRQQAVVEAWKARHHLPPRPDQQGAGDAVSTGEQEEIRGATLRLAPVLSRGLATSLREAIRQRVGYLTADGVEIDGQRYLIRPAVDASNVELSLRPDATYFALMAQGDNLARHGLAEGDYVLFESQRDATNGGLVATLIGGDLGIKSLTRKPGHSLLESDSRGQPAVVLTDSDAPNDELVAEYATCLPPVEYWPADDARILGSAAVILQSLAPGPRPPVAGHTSDEGKPEAKPEAKLKEKPDAQDLPAENFGSQNPLIMEIPLTQPTGDPAPGEVPGESPLPAGGSVPIQ